MKCDLFFGERGASKISFCVMSFERDYLPDPPEEPLPGDCCGNGCDPCVLDVYQDLLQRWKEKNNIQGNCTQPCGKKVGSVMSMTRYMPFQLVSIQKLTVDTSVYKFRAVVFTDHNEVPVIDIENNRGKCEAVVGKMDCLPGQHLMLRHVTVKDGICDKSQQNVDKEIVTRAYTPISVAADHAIGNFEVLIKIYENGIMSRFVSQLEIGDITFWRGPYGSFRYERNCTKTVLMLCAGTGVAPMYPIAKMIVDDEKDESLLRMAYACRSIDNIPLRKEIHSLSSFWNFQADIFLSCSNMGPPLYGESLKFGRIGKDYVQSEVDKWKNRKALVLICGPSSFNETMAEAVRDCGVSSDSIHIF